jgi:hypothetical protein
MTQTIPVGTVSKIVKFEVLIAPDAVLSIKHVVPSAVQIADCQSICARLLIPPLLMSTTHKNPGVVKDVRAAKVTQLPRIPQLGRRVAKRQTIKLCLFDTPAEPCSVELYSKKIRKI